MPLRTRYIVLIGTVWMLINIFLYKDRIIGDDWSLPDGRKPIPAIQVVLLSYHRSGSSFLGELLSSCDSCSYFFEPLYYEDNIRNTPSAEAYRNSLQKIFSCKKEILDELRSNPSMWIVRKFGKTMGIYNGSQFEVVNLCKTDTMHVIKTIRLRVADFEKLWTKIPTLKLVHLVRDPRAVCQSINNMANLWSIEDQSPEQHCKDVYRDVVAARHFPPERYYTVHYEDLVLDTLNVTKSIYAFLGLSITPAVESYIQRHTQAEKDSEGKEAVQEYFSTFRNSSFQVDQWKAKISPERLKRIEQSCRNVMELLGYKPISQQPKKQQNQNKNNRMKT